MFVVPGQESVIPRLDRGGVVHGCTGYGTKDAIQSLCHSREGGNPGIYYKNISPAASQLRRVTFALRQK